MCISGFTWPPPAAQVRLQPSKPNHRLLSSCRETGGVSLPINGSSMFVVNSIADSTAAMKNRNVPSTHVAILWVDIRQWSQPPHHNADVAVDWRSDDAVNEIRTLQAQQRGILPRHVRRSVLPQERPHGRVLRDDNLVEGRARLTQLHAGQRAMSWLHEHEHGSERLTRP